MGMIKNELVKFFVSSRIFIYGGTILLFIFVDNIVFGDNSAKGMIYRNFLKSNMETQIFAIPIILAPVVSDIFTQDYRSGCMKFFMIYKRREKVFAAKAAALVFITETMLLLVFGVLTIIYLCRNGGQVYGWKVELLREAALFTAALIPVLLIYIMICILLKNSGIICVLVFLLLIMSDFIPKVMGNITPRRFLWGWVLNNGYHSFDIVLFLAYSIFFAFIDIRLFVRKEILC
ncbi:MULTISPECIES: hypothetical protein [Clostridium]|uniref:ABC-2 family transporter protein n=1 Tax=Clostridium lapidicellarium TaxID=3240931 RepID=A0ABV4DS19_9CLOT